MRKKTPRYIVIGTLLLISILVWHCKKSLKESDYYSPKSLATHYNGEEFVGSATCMECHSEIYNTHLETAHFNTSTPPSATTIKGSFEKGQDTLSLQDVHITLHREDDTFYEQKDFKSGGRQPQRSEIDIVIGSGVKGQSYLSWNNDRLFQLQTSYYTPTDSWVNSPNFSSRNTTRPITDACLKCHTTFAKNSDPSGKGNQYDNKNFLLGVDCERCHRPALKHVVYHRKNPDADEAKFIILNDTLSRKQRLDICAQCHSGLRSQQKKGNPFSFVAGENLDDYSKNFYVNRPNPTLDVHGNQYGLLTSSKCFEQSPNLTCITCHDPHKNQRGNLNSFNQKCVSCHSITKTMCSASKKETAAVKNNCVTCHMPVSPSQTMQVKISDQGPEVPVFIRSHLIKIYQDSLLQKN